MTRVAVLKGGRSLERQVSLRSGARVEDALGRLGHEIVPVDVGGELVDQLREAAPDVAFVAIHGADGEDGTVQELLELLGIPYTGSGPAACVRCWDKAVAKHALLDAGIPTPAFFSLGATAFRELGAARALPDLEERLGLPLVVKPARQGSALGVRVAGSAAAVPGALMHAASYDDRVLLERWVEGRDLAVSVLEGPDGPQALPVVEAIPEGDAYDFDARYEIGRTRFECPAALDGEVTGRAQELSLRVWELLGCRGVARVDLMLDEESGELWVLEANTVPGFTATSLLPLAAEAADLDFDALVARLVDLALSRAPAA